MTFDRDFARRVLVAWAMARDPAQRPTAGQLAEALSRMLRELPLDLPPAGDVVD